MNFSDLSFRSLLLTTALTLSACAVTPEPFTAEERAARIAQDKALIFGETAPVSAPIGLEEAMARALKFNLDHRAEMLNQVVSQAQLDLSGYDMLPRLVSNAGYTARSNDSASASESVLTRSQSLEPSVSSERRTFSSQTALTWNILDFGVSYIRARQNADRTLMADEQRRKVIHNIIQDVRTAYWRAVAAERLLGRIEPLMKRTQAALDAARTLEKQQVRAPLDELQYQRNLLSTLERLRSLRRELIGAKVQLGALMNLRPGTAFRVVVPDERKAAPPRLSHTPDEMEEIALDGRPELNQAAYQARISRQETYRILLEMLPGVSMNVGGNYDSNRYTVNHAWASWGGAVAWNLMNLFSTPARLDVADADQQLQDVKRAALSMAVLAQVNVAYLRYQQAQEEYGTAQEQADVEARIHRHLTTVGENQQLGELAVIQAEAENVFAMLRRDIAFAGLQNAHGAVMVSVGADPLPQDVAAPDLPGLSQAIAASLKGWEDGSALRRALETAREAAKARESAPPEAPPAPAPKISSTPTLAPERG